MSRVSLEAKLILVGFATLQALLTWLIRFVPRPPKPLAQTIVGGVVGLLMTSEVVVELLLYSAATGHVPLINDSFFLVGITIQSVLNFLILIDSNRIIQQKYRQKYGGS